MLNKYLLIACICIVIAVVIYVFYCNRLMAFLFGFIIRLSWWNQGGASIWLEIGSIHFSLLTGRILLRDVRYHSCNQTAKIVKAQITWRYWIRKPTAEEELSQARIGEEDHKQSHRVQSCRIQLSLQGFEWFLYNRTEAYENILANLQPQSFSRPTSRAAAPDTKSSAPAAVLGLRPLTLPPFSLTTPEFIKMTISWFKRQLPNFDPKDLLPVGIEATNSAIICGNPSTPELLVSEFRKAEGTFGIVPARSKYDLYKQIIGFKFETVLIRYVENEDYKDPMPVTGQIVHEHIKAAKLSDPSSYLLFTSFQGLWRRLGIYSLIGGRGARTIHRSSFGRRRKSRVDEDTPVGAEFSSFEYAVNRRILEAPVLDLSYYADVVGNVPSQQDQMHSVDFGSLDIGNGDLSPEWGIDMVIRRGVIRYGPWADRQRVELQRAFFPPTYLDVAPATHLNPGDKRVWMSLNVFVELRDETTLNIPFREASKNWQWDGFTPYPRPRKREPASIHITAGDSSSISYVMPMIAGPTGYEPRLEVHLDSVAVTSSLNDIKLLTAESCRIRGDLPTPLIWNAERQWTFTISLRQPVIYLLRDHVNMLMDLAKDWASGPSSDYQRWVPMIYAIELDMYHFEMNQYANDHNIIDKPLIKEENAMITLRGRHLRNRVQIPSNIWRPEATTVPITIEAPDVSVRLSLPRWNTHALHAPSFGTEVGRIGMLRVNSSYRYFSDVREDHVEQLKMDFMMYDVAFKALGWTIRFFMVMRDNYLGSFTHFSTLFEYLDKRKKGIIGDPLALKYREGKSNVLQVEIALTVENGKMFLAAGLPGYETPVVMQDPNNIGIGTSVVLSMPAIQVQFRMNDFFMEMSCNIDTVSGAFEDNCLESTFRAQPHQSAKEAFFIDGIDITANRLFGPQPRTATYVCIWEVRLGSVRAALSAWEARIFMAAGNAFRLNFKDSANAPAIEFAVPVEPDITFLKLTIDAVEVTWLAGLAAVSLSLPSGLRFSSNDRPGGFHRKATSFHLPSVRLKVLVTGSSERNTWLEASELVADAYLDIYLSPVGWRDNAQTQTDFIQAQDELTGRARLMFEAFDSEKPTYMFRQHLHRNGIYLPHPRLTSAQSHETGHGSPKRLTRDSMASKTQHWSAQLSQLSESEGEEGISEADRDARLARSRSVPMTTMDEDDKDMSSGDESDNEDLTDAETLDSMSSHMKSADYHHLSRHFSAQPLQTPSLWDGSPFVLTHDIKFLAPPNADQNSGLSEYNNAPSLWEDLVYSPREGVHTTVVRCESRKGVQVRMTPLLLSAVIQLEEELEDKPLSPELYLDSLMANYLGDFSGSNPLRPKRMVVDLHVTSVCMRLLHRVTIADQENTVSLPIANDGHPHSKSTVTVIDIYSTNWHAVGDSTAQVACIPPTWTYTMAFGNTAVTLDAVGGRMASTYDQNMVTRKTAFALHILGINGKFTPSNAQLVLDGISVELDDFGPEYLAGTGLALTSTGCDLLRVQRKWKHYSTALTTNIIYHALRTSNDKSIVDPLSTIQPSYLVQRGRPHELRTDTTFKFIFHLRNCLWHLTDTERQAFSSSEADLRSVPVPDDVITMLESRLASLAIDSDASNVASQATLEKLYPGLHKRTSATKDHGDGRSWNSVTLKVNKATIIVQGPSTASTSEFGIDALSIAVRIRAAELIQPSAQHSGTFSQVSLREKGQQRIQHIVASISLGTVSLTIFPYLMRFAQEVFRVRRQHLGSPASGGNKTTPGVQESLYKDPTEPTLLDVTLALHHLRVQAVAENLAFEFGSSSVKIVSGVFIRPEIHPGLQDQSMNHSILFDDMFIHARSPTDTSKKSDQDILASIVLSGGKVNVVLRREPSASMILRAVASIQGVHFSVPRSALRLYRFVEEWRADFLPGIEATLKALLSELEKAPQKPISPVPSRSPVFQFHGYIQSFRISLQVMHGTWLSWEAQDTVMYLKSSDNNSRRSSQAFGLQLASQIYSISSKPTSSQLVAPSTRLKLELPTLSLTGHYDGDRIHTLASVEFFRTKLKPSHWDTLLAVQQKFGQDFNDLVLLVGETRRNQAIPTKSNPSTPLKSLKYTGFLKMRGFQIGLESASSTAYLECKDIDGGIDNDIGREWHVKLSDLALSLAPHTAADFRRSSFNRHHRSAFVNIDFQVNSGSSGDHDDKSRTLHVVFTKIHAVMQPSSIGEVADFIDHIQMEMMDRKEQRALELEAFKAKTRSVMKTFEVNIQDGALEEQSSWVNQYTISLAIRNIGVAFPLTLDQDLQLPQTGSLDSTAVRAFLFSIKHLSFGAQHGETGQAAMKGFSFQFVSSFRQSVPTDFSGENHYTRNRLLYPEVTAHLRSVPSMASRHTQIAANVSGFVLDLDSTIPDYVFSLIDVYRHGKDRVTRMTASPRRQTEVESSFGAAGAWNNQAALPAFNVLASMTFFSGKVRVYSGSSPVFSRSRSWSTHPQEPTDDHFLDVSAEVLKLPVVSVWTEYRRTPLSQKMGPNQEGESSILMFKSTIHSSENTLRPSLLPFLTEVVEHVEGRMRKTTGHSNSYHPSSAITVISANPSETTADPPSSMQISFSLRIDQSKLELTCMPDVNVLAGVHWDSGGFAINVSPGARRVTFTGSVGGLTVGLKHGFLSEDCARLDARNLTFSMTFAKMEFDPGKSTSSISVVLDTEFLGVVRFSRLQDVLCFKAVWLDRIPIFTSDPISPANAPPLLVPSLPASKQEFTTALLIRIRQIKLDVDLGQSISAVTLDLRNAILRTKLTEALDEVSLSVIDVAIAARGNVSGYASVPDFVFRTARRREVAHTTKMLELNLKSGALNVVLESDHQRLLQYRAEPLEVEIFDDWSTEEADIEEQPLRLSFIVCSTEIVAVATVGTIPKLLSYANKFGANLDAQREGASKESATYGATRSPKPDNPLSAVANAMIHSARTKFKEVETSLSCVILQHMSLQLDLLRLVVFPRTMGDVEMAQFVVSEVHARLDRLIKSDGLPGNRDLHLSFSSITISKFNQLNHTSIGNASPSDGKTWLNFLLKDAPEATIVGLPSMNMHMLSEEEGVAPSKVLVYDFHSKFIRREGMRSFEDIYITLNVSLYSWLTLLRKNLSREMNQVQATAIAPTLVATLRRKNPERPQGADVTKKESLSPTNVDGKDRESLSTPLSSSMSPTTVPLVDNAKSTSPVPPSVVPSDEQAPDTVGLLSSAITSDKKSAAGIMYRPRSRNIERLTMRQLGEATPDVMHPFFMKKAGFNLEDSLPQYVNEYAAIPLEKIMEGLLRLYSKQLTARNS